MSYSAAAENVEEAEHYGECRAESSTEHGSRLAIHSDADIALNIVGQHDESRRVLGGYVLPYQDTGCIWSRSALSRARMNCEPPCSIRTVSASIAALVDPGPR